MPESPLYATMSRREKITAVTWSIARTLLGAIIIWSALALVPEQPDTSVLLPITIVVVGCAFYVWFLRHQLKAIDRAKYPTLRSLEALILAAVLFLAVFAAIYVVISTHEPGAFTEPLDHFTAYYFALTVLATVGFGDITPVTVIARSFAMLQMGIDIAFIAVLVKIVGGAAQRTIAKRRDTSTAG